MEKKMWATLLHLGSNMWQKKLDNQYYKEKFDREGSVYRNFLLCDMDVWHKVIDFLPSCGINTVLIDMGEAVRLDSHPELAVEGSLTKDEFRAELKRIRDLGMTPLPKFNFSCGHSAWLKDYAYMVGSETYYRVCEDIVRETIELFDKPEFFHLGLEEEQPAAQGMGSVVVSRTVDKKIEDAKRFFSICDEYGVRPWIWVDPDTIESFGGEERFCREVPKHVLLSNWYYPRIVCKPEEANPSIRLYNKIGEWGYEQVPTASTWHYRLNLKDTMRYCRDYVNPDSIKGYMSASWLFMTPEKLYGQYNDAYVLGNAKKDIYPDAE